MRNDFELMDARRAFAPRRRVRRPTPSGAEGFRDGGARVRAAFARGLAVVLSSMIASVSGAEGADRFDEVDHWSFSGGVEAGVYGTTAEANASGTPLVGPRATNINFLSDDVSTVIADLDGENDVLSGLLGVTFEAMSPAALDIAARPRFFVGVSLLPPLTQETSVARAGDPGEFGIPADVARAAGFVGERLIVGTGSQITSQHQGLQVHVALGAAFTTEIGGHRVRIKPSIQYSRVENKVSVEANRAVRIVNQDPLGPPGTGRIRSLNSYRLLGLRDDFTEVYHGVGPALEIEVDTDERVGPFDITLFMKGAGSHSFGDLETEFVVSNPDFPAEQVRFEYENDPWAFQVTTGVRLRLVTGRP